MGELPADQQQRLIVVLGELADAEEGPARAKQLRLFPFACGTRRGRSEHERCRGTVIAMGTWDIGHFDNDNAADFAIDLDEAAIGEREALIRGVLLRTADATGYLSEAQQAVAAAALIAAQRPGGGAIEDGKGPEEPMPVFSEDLRALAVEALDRVVSDDFGLVETWVAPQDGARWLSGLRRLRAVLAPPAIPDVPLFELEQGP